jgi:uncharacterized MAPEG superfamily protein
MLRLLSQEVHNIYVFNERGKKMKPELLLLLWAVLLTFVQMLVAVSGATLQVGLPALAGNREGLAPCTGWAGRAHRAHHNMLESLVLFAALVLVAVLSQKTNSTTLLGAQLFVWARLAYAVVYLAGIPWLRTAVWFVSVIGLALIFFQLV